MMLFFALTIGFLTSLIAGLALLATQHLHGHYSLDSAAGVQKLHSAPTPRVGGLLLAAGAVAAGAALPADAAAIWWVLCLSALPAFASGLIEDLTKQVGARWRLLATIAAGLLFTYLTGYRIERVDIPGADWLLAHPLFSIAFTAFAIGGIANAVNIIDGVNGLASGTALIVLAGFAAVAYRCDDWALLACILLSMALIFGFFVLNFPLGRIFLGDAGAYGLGFLLAVIAVALPERNPSLSPLIGLLGLAYPVVETAISIFRRLSRAGAHPGRPDRLHLHSLIYRSRSRRLARLLRKPHLRNPLTSVILWSLSVLANGMMVMNAGNSAALLAGVAVVAVAYLCLYRRVALLPPIIERRPRPQLG